jgi:hypothetical protein
MQPDCKWPFSTDAQLAPDEDVLIKARDLQELIARREYDVWQAWDKDRAKYIDETIVEELRSLHEDITELTLKQETLVKYGRHWSRFKAWVAREQTWLDGAPLQTLPAPSGLVALFLLQEHTRGASYGTLREICAAVADAHSAAGQPDPCHNVRVSAALRFARRTRDRFKPSGDDDQQQHEEARNEEAG